MGIRKPERIIIKDGRAIEEVTIRLDKLDADTLAKMCEAFTDAVFKNAGKNRPNTVFGGNGKVTSGGGGSGGGGCT